METITPGMTRADLLKVFREEGGIYSGIEGHSPMDRIRPSAGRTRDGRIGGTSSGIDAEV